jgi:hypothetical protein
LRKSSNTVLGLILSLGMAWCFAEGTGAAKAAKADQGAADKNAISVATDEHCDKAKADCPKDKHCAKPGQCRKPASGAKTKHAEAAGVGAAAKPAEAEKAPAPTH